MSASIKRHFDTLKVLSKAPHKLRNAVIDHSKADLVRALCEIVYNTLEGNIKLTEKDRQKLKRYHRYLYQLSRKSLSVKKKKQILKQRGGFLMTLLPPALAILATLLR